MTGYIIERCEKGNSYTLPTVYFFIKDAVKAREECAKNDTTSNYNYFFIIKTKI